jgi:hypothetical protein
MKLMCLFAIFTVLTLGFAQAPDTVWTKTFGGGAMDRGYSVQECVSGGFIVAGHAYSFGAGVDDVYLIRTNADGNTLWTKVYGGVDTDWGCSLAECDSGGFIIAGVTGSFGAGHTDIYLLRIDAGGDTLWAKTYGGDTFDYGFCVRECAAGGFVISGETESFGVGYSDVYLIRTDTNGDTLWTKTYGGDAYDYGESVQECASGGFIIAGGTDSYGAGSYDVYLIRTDANGDTLWTRTYGGVDGEYGWSVAECSSGGFIVTGWTETSAVGGQDAYIVRTDADGNAIWTKNYGGYAYDAGYSVIECAAGGYVIAGEKWLYDTQWQMDIYLIRIDGNGDTLWTKNYGGANNERAYSIQECESGGFIITGWTDSYGNGDADVYLLRLNSEGGIEESSQTQAPKSLFIHPNPSSGRTFIRYGLPERSDVSLILYDNAGRLVKVLYTGTQGEGHHEVAVDRDGLSAGVYFIRFTSTSSNIGSETATLAILN